jgi:hypothetical protein
VELDWDDPIPLKFTFKGRTPNFDLSDCLSDSDRLAYVLRFLRPYYVKYNLGESPICYIGQGSGKRIQAHKVAWLTKIALVLDGFVGFEYVQCRPRKKGPGGTKVHLQVEKDLIGLFSKKFGERPLFNRMLGSQETVYIHDAEVSHIFRKGSGPGFNKQIDSPVSARRLPAQMVG